MSLPFALLVGYCVLQAGLGLWLGRRVRSESAFYVSGRGLGPGLLFATLLAANIGAGSTVGATGLGYRDGVAAWWWVGSAALGSAVLALWVGPALRREAARHDLKTVGDYLEHRYDRRVRVIASLLVALGALAILAGQLIAMAFILEAVAGVEKPVACLLGGGLIVAYFSAGGLYSSVRVNIVQLVVKLAGFALVLPLALAGAGGWSGVVAAAPSVAGYWDVWHNGGSGVAFLAVLAPAFVISPGILQKVFAARDDAAVRRGVGMNAAALLLYAGVPVLLGIVARVRFPTLASHELALPTLLVQGVPPLVGGLGLAAVFSAELSAADAVLFMLSTSLSRDVYRRFLNPAASDARALGVARATGVVSGTLGVLLAIAAPSVVDALSLFYTLLTVSLFVPILAGLLVKRSGTSEALAAIATGIGVTAAIALATGGRGLGWLSPALVGLVGAGTAFAAVAMTRARNA